MRIGKRIFVILLSSVLITGTVAGPVSAAEAADPIVQEDAETDPNEDAEQYETEKAEEVYTDDSDDDALEKEASEETWETVRETDEAAGEEESEDTEEAEGKDDEEGATEEKQVETDTESAEAEDGTAPDLSAREEDEDAIEEENREDTTEERREAIDEESQETVDEEAQGAISNETQEAVDSYEDNDFTLTEDGTLVIRDNEGAIDRLKSTFCTRTLICSEDEWYENVNPNVKKIIIEEGSAFHDPNQSPCGVCVAELVWLFPNVEKITSNVRLDVKSKGHGTGGVYFTSVSVVDSKMEARTQGWNSRFRNKVVARKESAHEFYNWMQPTEALTIAGYNYSIKEYEYDEDKGEVYIVKTNFKEQVTNAGYTYEEIYPPLSKASVEVASTVVYTGKAMEPTPVVVAEEVTLKEGIDYTVSYSNNNKLGTAKVTIVGIGNYEGTKTATFKIILGATSKVTLTNVATGIKVSWEKVPGATRYNVYRGSKFLFKTSALQVTDKDVKYKNGTKYVYKVIAEAKGVGKSTKSRTATTFRLMPVGIKTLSNSSKGKMTVTYDKNSGSSGYVVRFGLKSDMSDAKVITVKGAGTTSRTFSGLKRGARYYVQVRTYKLDNGIRYYSGYCTTKTVKIVN